MFAVVYISVSHSQQCMSLCFGCEKDSSWIS